MECKTRIWKANLPGQCLCKHETHKPFPYTRLVVNSEDGHGKRYALHPWPAEEDMVLCRDWTGRLEIRLPGQLYLKDFPPDKQWSFLPIRSGEWFDSRKVAQ